MFDNLKNIGALMGQARELKQKMAELQAELERKTVEGEAGAGAVRVTMNGKFEVLAVTLDPTMITTLAGEGAEADKQMIQELIAAAFNAAMQRAQEVAREEMGRITGMNLPGMDQLLG